MKKTGKLILLLGIFALFFSCRNEEEERPKIDKIAFETNSKTSIEGDTVKITVIAEPQEAKAYDRITYWVSDNSLLQILPESNNDYVVFKSLKAGQGIVKASVNGRDIFCDVKIISSNGTLIPYIVMSDYVIEGEIGETHHIVASLIGGNPADNNDFVWSFTGNNKNVINMAANNNIAVVDMVNSGDCAVTVSHKKATFSVNTLVFVKEKGETPVYISTNNNVINLDVNDDFREYSVNLYGKNITGNNNNNGYYLFRHDIVNENNEIAANNSVISLSSSNNVGTIRPRSKGIAKIRVSHQDADYPIEIVVIVNEQVEIKYIDIEDTVIVMNEGEFTMVRANIIGDVPEDRFEKFEFVNDDNNIIDISGSQNIVSIRALKQGRSVIKIKNKYVDFDREMLVIVNGKEGLTDQEKYITTNQNVITTEVNAEALLTMTLVGGNSADANNFVWTVDDGSVIEMVNQTGKVRYNSRAMLDYIDEKFEATALIKAKKIGTTTITLENPKARSSFQVVVKVYKQGVFGVVPVVLSGQGIYRIDRGKATETFLKVAAGLEKNMVNVSWKSSDTNVFSVPNHTNLSGFLKGENNGIAMLTVTGSNLKSDFTATVIVGDENYFNEQPYIYVANPYMTLIKDRTVSFRVLCENVSPAVIGSLSIVNNSGDKLEVNSYRDTVTVKGLSFGEGEIVVSGEGLNTIKIAVMVEDYALTPEMPYYLRPEKYIYGVVKGNSVELTVDLVGGIANNEKDITWKIADSNVADIRKNGKKCIITGKNEGQTLLTVSHPQSQNKDVDIVVYVALSNAELKSKVVVHVPEQNILLKLGEARYISVVTNAADGQGDFRWGNGNANVVGLRVNGDKKSAFLDALTIGSAVVTVGYGNQTPFVVYVSVVNPSSEAAYINTPSIVEMTAGQTITVNAVTSGVYNKYDIAWVSQDEKVARAYGNGDSCTLSAFKGGKTVIKVSYQNFVKDIVLRVYETNAEMASAYIFSGEQSRYIINKGDIVNIGLVFGLKGYPEYDIPNIRWTTNDNSKIELRGNGKSAGVKGLAAGIWEVSAADNYGNDINIEIVVQDAGKPGKYYFSVNSNNRIKGMLSGTDDFLEIKVFNGANEVYNVTGIEYSVSNSDIIRVEGKEGGVRVYAKPGIEGQSYITVTHDLADDGKILIYTSLTEGGLVNAYPIMVEKANYLIGRGDSFSVSVRTLDENPGKLANLSYGLEKQNGVLSIQERNKKEITVNAASAGSEIILVRYNAEIVQRVYVTVMERGYGISGGYMVTENIIGLVKGQIYETWVDTDSNWGIEWKSENSYICAIYNDEEEVEEITELDGKKTLLKAHNAGNTTVTVKRGDIERYIYVFVVNTPEELRTYNAVNIEQRRYKIPKGMDVTVNMHSYQGKVLGETKFEDYYRYSVPYGNVITVNKIENGKISVKGINEGTAAVRITNSYYNSETVVYVEVYPVSEGEIGAVTQTHYITAEKTLYIIEPDKKDVYIQVGVVPEENFYGDAYWEWEGYDENIISVESIGRGAVISRVGNGQTRIRVFNQKCDNHSIEITVIAGQRFISDSGKTPYIYVEKDLFEMFKGSGNLEIPYSIVNVDSIAAKNITFSSAGSGIKIAHDAGKSVFKVEAVSAGIARFEIKYGDLKKEVFVLVKENPNAGNIYLTTSENFVIASIGELRTINVDLTGYDEIDGNKIKWSLSGDSPRNVVQLAGNGLTGQIYGVAEGSVVINITHERNDEYKAAYPLSINVKIVKDKSKEKVIYLTTQRNVIETVEGAPDEMIYIQKVGGDAAKSQIIWKVDNSSIVSLNHSGGYSARLTVHKEGSVKITASNIETPYDLNIIVVVRKSTGSNVYITTASNLIWLSPGEKNHRISVDLANGQAKDYNMITWNAYEQIPSDNAVSGTGSKVINIVSSNEQCYIDAVNIGVAYIYVECKSRADLPLIITVYVSHFREMQFSAPHKDVVMNEMEIVELNLPTYERLKDKASVWAEDLSGGPTNVVDVYYTNSLVLLHGRKTGSAVIKAAVDGKEGYAQMTVSVLEKHDPDVNRMVIGKNLLVVSDIAGQMALNASVTGPNIYEGDLDQIQWEIIRNYAEEDIDHKKPLLDIMPRNVPYSVTKSVGRTVQVTPKSIGNAVIRVSHPKVTQGYWKDIYIVIAEMGNTFTINKTEVTVNISRPAETVAVNIAGGTTRDYEQVRWVAKMQQRWDGTLLEIVRVMGSGREVVLYPINNGETEVYAFYNGKMLTVNVKCVSDYYFDITNRNELMYPGEVRDMPYEIAPASNSVTWNYTPGDAGPVVIFTDIAGSAPGGGGNVTRMLRVTAQREGSANIIGMPINGRPVQINITVRDDVEFGLQDNQPGIVTAMNVINPAPQYVTRNIDGSVKGSSDGVVKINYFIYPGDAYIKCATNPLPTGLSVDISPAQFLKYDSRRRAIHGGTITFTGTVEMNRNIDFQLYKANPSGGVEIPVPTTIEKPTRRTVNVIYYFRDLKLEPVFIRGDGKYSNLKNYADGVSVIGIDNIKGGDQQYWLKNGKAIPRGETIEKSFYHEGEYYMTLGDGEEHYLIFDREYDNANVNITSLVKGDEAGNVVTLADGNGGRFQAEIVNFTIDGEIYKAVRLSGGPDYIVYNRVGIPHELFIGLKTKYGNDNPAATEEREYWYNVFRDEYVDDYESHQPISISNRPYLYNFPLSADYQYPFGRHIKYGSSSNWTDSSSYDVWLDYFTVNNIQRNGNNFFAVRSNGSNKKGSSRSETVNMTVTCQESYSTGNQSGGTTYSIRTVTIGPFSATIPVGSCVATLVTRHLVASQQSVFVGTVDRNGVRNGSNQIINQGGVYANYNSYNITEYCGHNLDVYNIFAGSNDEVTFNEYGKKLYMGDVDCGDTRNSFGYVTGYYKDLNWSRTSAQFQIRKHDRGTFTTAPYYIFNRFPYRYEVDNTIKQMLKISDCGGIPMPSTDRNVAGKIPVVLTVKYNKYDPKTGMYKDFDLNINIACVSRPSHFQYFGKYHEDRINTDDDEVKGPVTHFGALDDSAKKIYAKWL